MGAVMSVRPIDFAMLQRMNEVTQIKQNEISKPMIDQANINNQFNKETNSKSEQVGKKDDVEHEQKKFDAKEKGSNNYFGSNSSKKDDEEDETEGRVFVKGQKGFDIKI